ncbi:transposase [Lewinella sp. W8]|uniref:transposase n=1 Tax=Lewinella sp. W8 TaxID=2528208 RepID=UPI0010689ED1|nr:transposase [Lewinella sp. W8]MTB49763.1 hypothetical protein [Lewinella sp. W8]
MAFTEKQNRLPHRDLGEDYVHLVYRTFDSLPQRVAEEFWRKHQIELLTIRQSPTLAPESIMCFEQRATERAQKKFHRLSAKFRKGKGLLHRIECKRVVIDSWKFLADKGDLELIAVCVMNNHVHVLIGGGTNLVDLPELMHRHKTFTAVKCNKLLGRKGKFWAYDFFDRDLRPGTFHQVLSYILNNPVAARSVQHWTEYPGVYLTEELVGKYT